jgi:hypothetical protein
MTRKTRRRLFIGLVVAALAAPAELVLLEALATPNSDDAVRQWVAGLSADQINAAADQIQSYPFAYRREIMRALPPSGRSLVWRDHLQTYIVTRPGLDANAVNVLEAAMALATPEALSEPSSSDRAQLAAVAEQVKLLLGEEDAKFLLYRLGPPDARTASIEPLRLRLGNYVRGLFVALAMAEDCDCAVSWGCDGYTTHCKANTGCDVDEDWPMCGWFWNSPCDGLCWAGIEG